jgi:hypothetical protein
MFTDITISFLFEPGKVASEALIGLTYQVSVEAFLAPARLVSGHEQDCRPPGVKSEGNNVHD